VVVEVVVGGKHVQASGNLLDLRLLVGFGGSLPVRHGFEILVAFKPDHVHEFPLDHRRACVCSKHHLLRGHTPCSRLEGAVFGALICIKAMEVVENRRARLVPPPRWKGTCGFESLA